MPVQDRVFKTVQDATLAKQQYGEQVVNATIGALYDETPELVTYDAFYSVFDSLSRKELAAYASHLQGVPAFRDALAKWLSVSDVEIIATPGSTGALSLAIHETLDEGQTIVMPSIYWGPYELMAQFQHLQIAHYEMFHENGFNVKDFKRVTTEVIQEQGRLTVLINDPAQNPTGYSMTDAEWAAVMKRLRSLTEFGEINVILDIAYIDYTKSSDKRRSLFQHFTDLPEGLHILVCTSLSKTATAYGLRLGGLVLFSKQKEQLFEQYSAGARSVWSNVNNGGQLAFAKMIQTPALHEAFVQEQDQYIQMLSARSTLFIQEADRVGLQYFPHTEGFFVTLPLDVKYREAVDQALRQELIYTISLAGGVRVALCAIPLRQVQGLAGRIKQIMDQVVRG
jgi:aspartate/tyrosine/aromatic aminotransferase